MPDANVEVAVGGCEELSGTSEAQREKVTVLPSHASPRPSHASRPSHAFTHTFSYRSEDSERVYRLRMEEFEHLWKKYEWQDRPNFLKALHICHHGGLHADDLQKLWADPLRKLAKVSYCLQLLIALCANTYFVISMDLELLMSPPRHVEERFLVCDALWRPIDEGLSRSLGVVLAGRQLVVIIELVLLAALVMRATATLITASMASQEWVRWKSVAVFSWRLVPMLSTFSSMRLLSFVSPRVLAHHIVLELEWLNERLQAGYYTRACWKTGWFVLSRVLCLCVGFDAFLVKLRMTMDLVDVPDISIRGVVGGLVFLFQLLSVVNLRTFVRKRLFIFIFGGEDGVLTTKEKAKEYLWVAILTKRLWSSFPAWLAMVMIVTFDDHDFQVMMLHEKHPYRQDSEEPEMRQGDGGYGV